jgi:chromosome segregation ATPase
MRFSVLTAGIVLAVAGCATQDQLRQTEAEHGQAMQSLRAETERSESALAELRREVKQSQDSVRTLEVALNKAQASADAAKLQADKAQATSQEFLSNLLATREEQRRQLAESGTAFADLRRKTVDLESRLLAQQRLLDERNVVFNDAIGRLKSLEGGLQEAARRSTLLETQAKAGKDADDGLTLRLATLSKQVDETRSVINSQGLLQMMRDLEEEQRNTAMLRGSIEELQKAQTDSAMQAKNFYLDLDARVQSLKKAQTDLAAQNGNTHLDLDTRIQALSKALTDYSTQDRNAYLDLDPRFQELKKAQADFAEQNKKSYLDLDMRIQELKKAQADFNTQNKSSYLDLNTRIQELRKAQTDFSAKNEKSYLNLTTRIQDLSKAQADLAAQAKSFYLDFDSRIQALKQKLPAPSAEGKASMPAGSRPAATSESAVAPAKEPASRFTQ